MRTLKLKKRSLGQGMTEYIIIVALIAIAAIGVFTLFGDVVKNQVGAMAAELGGNESANGNNRAAQAGRSAMTLAEEEVNLSNYSKTATKGGKR
ncbi:pilus assembly protein [Pleionea sp. CnH1-48]|uniref:pilus assembly protein n=1 Tax=Pleionea sp. CnH1-48 TaxID=2954494 RepID=UPI0020969605|nr:pilus assembly protein [Pleionea sp. CnH1-48]MCO7223846.1 pilus assembly protein [Pleionea sp. CnH1-48]